MVRTSFLGSFVGFDISLLKYILDSFTLNFKLGSTDELKLGDIRHATYPLSISYVQLLNSLFETCLYMIFLSTSF